MERSYALCMFVNSLNASGRSTRGAPAALKDWFLRLGQPIDWIDDTNVKETSNCLRPMERLNKRTDSACAPIEFLWRPV